METVKCKCGFQLLILPSDKATGKAMERHLREHHDKKERIEARLDLLRQMLVIIATKDHDKNEDNTV